VRLVSHTTRGIEAHPPRSEEDLEIGGEVARRAVVPRDDQGGPGGLGVEERGQQVGPQARRDERALRFSGRERGGREPADGLVFVGVSEELAQGDGSRLLTRRTAAPSARRDTVVESRAGREPCRGSRAV